MLGRRVPLTLLLFLLAANEMRAAPATSGLLPQTFAGWQKVTSTSGRDPFAADQANGALLKEFGFTGYEGATYTRDNGTLHVKAARFADGSGAFGAFTSYVKPEMDYEQIGDRGVTSGDHILFQRGNIMVDA